MIKVQSVDKTYGVTKVLTDVSFEIDQGEVFGIIGPNGSGKSTLLKLLTGIEEADNGSVMINDQPLQQLKRKQLARWFAVLQQEGIPQVQFTVREVIEMGRFPHQSWYGGEVDLVKKEALIDDVMERMQLHPFENRYVSQLSGGERQRVGLAKVMVQEPRVLILDEPTTYLDIGYQIQMMDYIDQWQKESNLTVVSVLHDLNLAAQYCDRLMLLHKGKVVQTGMPQDIIDRQIIRDVYETDPLIIPHPGNQSPQILLQSNRR